MAKDRLKVTPEWKLRHPKSTFSTGYAILLDTHVAMLLHESSCSLADFLEHRQEYFEGYRTDL